MIKRDFLPYIFFLIISILYVAVLFSRIPDNNFLLMGDQFFRFSKEETFANAFYLRKMLNFGVFNAWQLTVQTPDVLFYSIIYKFGLNLIQAEKILFALIIFVTMSFSFVGFSRLSRLYTNSSDIRILLAITFWYSMNPYLMVLWHGGVYNLGSSFTYSLAPLIIYYFHTSLVNHKAIRAQIICALMLFAASFTFWMLAALCVLLFFYTIAILILNRKIVGTVIINGIRLLSIYIPMAAMIIYPIFHEYSNNKSDFNGTFVATFGNIDGGLLYQLLMWFSWGIYNRWTPRSIYPAIVSDFYFSPVYIVATILIYLLLGFLIYKKLKISKWDIKAFSKKNSIPLVFVVIFLISIFLAKGQEPPFGNIFLFLYENVPFFTVFRSSDHRFGFPAVLSLVIAMLILTKDFKKTRAFTAAIIVITLTQNFIFFTGDLLIGQNLDDKYIDRVISIPKPYEELANYINSQKDTFYILPNPSVEYGTFNLGGNGMHMGQDILPKLINKPFADVPVTSGMNIDTGRVLYEIIEQDAPQLLTLLPVKYVLQRKDIECKSCKVFSEKKLIENTDKEYENELFVLYKVRNNTPLINSNVETTYKKISPIKYEVELANIKDTLQINFMESYNGNWRLYLLPYAEMLCLARVEIYETISECQNSEKMIDFSDIQVKNNPKLKGRVFPQNLKHINTWVLSPELLGTNYPTEYTKTNPDGTMNIKVAIFYGPQSNYIFAVFVSLISVVISVIVVFLPASIIRRFRK